MLCKYENIIKEQHEKGIIERVDEKRREEKEKQNTTFHIMRYSHQQRILPKFVLCTMLPQKRRKQI